MALSDLIVRQAKAVGKDYTLADTDGLCLNVTAQGGKSWHFRYRWAKKQTRMSFGSYPAVSLGQARKERDKAQALLARNINPGTERRRERRAVQFASTNTFKVIYDEWYAFKSLSLKKGRQSTASQIERIFGKDVLPLLRDLPISAVTRHDLLTIVGKIEKRCALTTAEKVRGWLNELFRYALVKVPGMEHNPASDLDVVAMPKPPVVHNPFLRMPDLPKFLCDLRSCTGTLQTQLGLRLLLLTGVRTGELRLATPDQFDLDQGLWIIPPEIVKQLQRKKRKGTKKSTEDIPPYIVPLSAQAIEIVRYLLDCMKPVQKYLFVHRSDLTKRISENTLNAALHRLGYQDDLTGHGLRATLSTALNEIGYLDKWIEAQLSHADPNKVRGAYNHALYVEQRRHMMQDWADRLDLWEQGKVDEASVKLTLHLAGTVTGGPQGMDLPTSDTTPSVPPTRIATMAPIQPVIMHRLPAVAVMTPAPAPAPAELSAIQKERLEMLEIYEAPGSLPVPTFAKLAGKSKDQINREIKAGKLLSLSIGNRGQRIPDWQLDPLKHELVSSVLQRAANVDPWKLYRTLSRPHRLFDDRPPVEVVTRANLGQAAEAVCTALTA